MMTKIDEKSLLTPGMSICKNPSGAFPLDISLGKTMPCYKIRDVNGDNLELVKREGDNYSKEITQIKRSELSDGTWWYDQAQIYHDLNDNKWKWTKDNTLIAELNN
jgi:hypothetical protein